MRVLAAGPAVLGSLLIMLVLSGSLGRWAGILPLVWLACAAAALTPVGERIAVRVGCGFRRPTPAQAAVLQSAWATALEVTGIAAGKVELYVATAPVLNAYAAGRRSVAVTSRVVGDRATGRLPEGQLVAVLVHELGHRAIRTAQPMLFLAGLHAPWRAAASLLTGLASRLAGRQPRRGLMAVVAAGWAVAVARAARRGQWVTGGVLAVMGLAAVGPLAEAAISRRSELVADRFAADHGLAVPLAAALHALDDRAAQDGWGGLRASHPTPIQRIRALLATAADPVDVCHVVCQRNPSSPVPADSPTSAPPG